MQIQKMYIASPINNYIHTTKFNQTLKKPINKQIIPKYFDKSGKL